MKRYICYLSVFLLCFATIYTCCKYNKTYNTYDDNIDETGDAEQLLPMRIGKYLYLTENGVLHTNKMCVGIKYGKGQDGHAVYGMLFVDTAEYVESDDVAYCTRCFNDNLYERVNAISVRNKYGEADTIAME